MPSLCPFVKPPQFTSPILVSSSLHCSHLLHMAPHEVSESLTVDARSIYLCVLNVSMSQSVRLSLCPSVFLSLCSLSVCLSGLIATNIFFTSRRNTSLVVCYCNTLVSDCSFWDALRSMRLWSQATDTQEGSSLCRVHFRLFCFGIVFSNPHTVWKWKCMQHCLC